MKQLVIPGFLLSLALLAGTGAAHGELFEADSKRHGNSKMDIVVKEVERRERSSVLDIKITSVGSSVGSSFFLLCSIRQLAQVRGPYRYIIKLDDRPQRGQMLVGFLHNPDEKSSGIAPEFAESNTPSSIIDLNQFSSICDRIQ